MSPSSRRFLVLCSSLLLLSTTPTLAEDPQCNNWAAAGECTNNPGYMLQHCQEACASSDTVTAAEAQAVAHIGSFFDLSAKDIHGKLVQFDQFRGQVTVIVNVASYCGYTESHYKGLVNLWSAVKNEPVNILAFPCNQFGQQEPGSAQDIVDFAKNKGVEFTMMQKVDVNGVDSDLVYKFLKSKTGVQAIQWNFATYFVVSPDGDVSQHTGVEPMDLKSFTLSLLNEEL